MKLLLILIMYSTTLMSSSCYAQTFTHKTIVHETSDSTGLHYSPPYWIAKGGYIELKERKLTIHTNGQEPRTYKLEFEPLQHYRGLYFSATFRGRSFECWINERWLLVKRYGYMNYYHFKK